MIVIIVIMIIINDLKVQQGANVKVISGIKPSIVIDQSDNVGNNLKFWAVAQKGVYIGYHEIWSCGKWW